VTTVDLSLPTDDQLLAAASPNPETEAADVTAGDPDQVAEIGARLQRSGSDLDQVHGRSMRTQGVLAGAFANNGAPVYDAQTHAGSLPPGFADAGTRLHDAGRRITAVADELSSAINDVNAAQSGMWQSVDSRRRSFAAEVQAAAGPGGLIPEARIPALQARRASVAAQMQELVDSCGRDVITRVEKYQTVLEGCQQLLAELGPADGLVTGGSPGARYEGSTVPVPGLHPPEIYPVPPPRPSEPGFVPTPGGPGILVNVPGAGLGTGVQDGPASAPGVSMPPVHIDAARPGERVPPPRGQLPGFPGAARARRKTPVQGGGGLRARWKLPDGTILEWDSQHGALEKYNKRGKHLGEFDPETGKQNKGPDAGKEVEP
jgi:hypothetical protein